jgi:hypothetical protein
MLGEKSPSSSNSLDAQDLEQILGEEVDASVHVYSGSVREQEGRLYALFRRNGDRWLIVAAGKEPNFQFESIIDREGRSLYLCPALPRTHGAFGWSFLGLGPSPWGVCRRLGAAIGSGWRRPATFERAGRVMSFRS